MARTVRNPLELRTPVRTISSVMRNAPRQQFRPTQLDFGDGQSEQGGRGGMGVRGGQGNLTSVTRAPRETIAGGSPVSGGVTTPVSRGTTTGAPVARVQTGTSRAPQGQAKPAVTSTIKAPATKPVAAKSATAKAPVTTKTAAKAPVAAKTPVTSKLTTPAKTPVAAKTTVSTKAPVAAKTTTPVAKTPVKTPLVSPVKPTTPTTTKKTTSPLTSALKTAAIGAGTAALVNKLIGTKTPTGLPTKPTGIPATTTTTKPTGIPTTTATTKPTGIPTTTKPTGVPTSVLKPAATKPTSTATKAATAAATAKAATTGATGALTEDQIQAELDRVNAEKEANTVPEGAVTNEDGSYSVTENGMTTTYAADGSIIGMEAATDTTTGTDTTLTTGADTSNMTDLGEGYFADADGNIYGADGNLMYTVGADGSYVDANTSTADATTWTDPDTGETWNLGADGNWTQEGISTEDTTTWTDPDTGLTWNQGADGQWTQEGFDGSDDGTTVVDDTVVDDGSVDDYSNYVDDGTDYEELDAKGGSIPSKRYFDDGGSTYSDTDEEVQDFQNVGYNYGEFDDPTMTGNNSLYSASGGYSPTYARSAVAPMSEMVGSSSMNGVDVNFSDNGDGTASYWDGDQYVTVDSDTGSELFRTDSDGNIVDAASASSGSSMNGQPVNFSDNGDGTASYWDGQQYVTVDSDTGNELYRTDENGQIVDANNTNRPVGAITSVGSGNKPSFATTAANAAVNQKQPDQTGILDSLLNAVRDNPGLAGGAVGALIASLMDQAGSSDSAGPSQPVDISELTSFNPRTTDFGAGMVGGRTGTGSPLVSYQDYAEGYGDETPDDRLYSDLGISGWLREPDMNNYRDESGNLTDQSGNFVDEYGYLMDDGSAPEEETAVEDAYEAEEEPAMAAGGATHYTFGRVMNPAENLGLGQNMKKGGLSQAHTVHSHHTNPVIDNRVDFRKGSAVNGAGDGQSDDIPAWLADGEYVMDAELVSMLGNGSNKAGAKILDKFREDVRAHKRSAPLGKIPPKAKSPLNYLKESMNG